MIIKKPLTREPSEQLQKKMQSLSETNERCGKDSLCRIYGDKYQLNEENSLKFIAFVNTLSGKK